SGSQRQTHSPSQVAFHWCSLNLKELSMKRVLLLLSFTVGLAPASFAQNDHVQAGVYAAYFRLSKTKTDFAGVGARLGFGAFKHATLDAEMNSDFNRVFTEGFTDSSAVPPTVTLQRSNIRVLHRLFGPKVELGHNSFHPFLTVKGGFNHFFLDNRPA